MLGSCSSCSRRPVFVLVSSVLIALLTACSGGGGSTSTPPPPPTLRSIAVTPGTPSVAAGLSQQFKATGTLSDGTSSDITSTVTWTSGAAAVATINASGLATSKTQGTATITATSGSITGSATLTVGPAALVSMAVAPASVQIGATTQMKATGTYTDQSTQDLTSTVNWSVANSSVASISASGLLTSQRAGYSTVTATDGSIQGSGSVTVLAFPRYLYVSGDAGSTITRMAVDSSTGQPHFLGYIPNHVSNTAGFPCLTTDPDGTHVYAVTPETTNTSSYVADITTYSADTSTGTLTAIPGSSTGVPFEPQCLVFAPSGKFAYAIANTSQANQELVQFSVNADASLTLYNTTPLTYAPASLAIDPLGQYLYIAAIQPPGGATSTSYLYGYAIQSTGDLRALDGSPWSIGAGLSGRLAFHPSGSYLYLSNTSATEIFSYTVNRSTGAVTQTATIDSTCINPSGLQFSPDASHAYLTCGMSGNRDPNKAPFVNFSVAANGQLTVQNTALGSPGAWQMLVDPSGKFVYALGVGTDYSSTTAAGNVVTVFQVEADGSVKLGRQIAGRDAEYSMALVSGATPLASKTTNAYITTAGDNKLTPYTVAADGTLTAGASVTTAAGPYSGSMLPWGSDFLLATQPAPLNLYGYAVYGTTLLSGSNFGGGSGAGTPGIVISPSGTSAYGPDPVNNAIDLFSRTGTGQWSLTFKAGGVVYSYPAGAGAGPLTMDPSGRYVAVLNQTARSISLIEPAGAPATPDTALSFTPLNVTVDPTGNLFFVTGDDSKLHMFSSNGVGTLTDVADGTLLGNNTASVAIDPTGHFVYAAGPAGLNAFSIDATAGTLTPISLNLGVSLQNATCVSIDPTGKNLYIAVSNGTTNALYLFTINTDGTLTASNSNPVATPNNATSILFQATVQ